MVGTIVGAFILALVVWLLGSLIEPTPGNPKSRRVAFAVFVILVLIAIFVGNH